MSLDLSIYDSPSRYGHHELCSFNITHNLGVMAREAAIYECLWEPTEHGMINARNLIEPLSLGIHAMKDDPERFKKLEPDNGWGTYDNFLPWSVICYLVL